MGIYKFSLVLMLSFVLFSCSDKIEYQQLTNKIRLYEKAEFSINLKETFTNPYDRNDIELNMLLENPSGDTILLPCYFENGDDAYSQWKARFAPRQVGHYTYHFELIKEGKKVFESSKGNFESLRSDKDGFLHINNLWTLKYDSGRLFRGIGENIGWESRADGNEKYDYDYLLPTLSENGANFFRSWMAPNNFPLEWKKVTNTNRYSDTDKYFNPGGVKRLDEVVEMADSLNLHMMLAFDSHNTLIEGNQWEIHNYNSTNGGPANNPTEFFTLKESRDKYKNRLRYIVARWGYSTSIGAWEFFNEIDNAAFTKSDSIRIPHDAITSWHKEMASYLKEIDPYDHIVTTSVSHREIKGLYDLKELDLNQMHIYKRTNQIPKEILRYTKAHNQPFSWGEFGYEWDWNKNFLKIEDGLVQDFKKGLWYGLFSPTPILPMSWWWEFFDERNMAEYFNGVAEINKQMLEAGNGSFEIIPVRAGEITSMAVKTGDKIFVYLVNNTESKKIANVQLTIQTEGTSFELQSFKPDIMKYSILDKNLKKGLINIPISLQSKEEMLFIFSPNNEVK